MFSKESTQKFILVSTPIIAALAIAVCLTYFSPKSSLEQRPISSIPTPSKSPKEYFSRYVVPQTNRFSVGIIVQDEALQPNSNLSVSVVQSLATNHVSASASLLQSSFITDGLLTNAMINPQAVIPSLHLQTNIHVLFLGKQSVAYTTNSALDDLVTATMQCQFIGVVLPSLELLSSETLQTVGAGFSIVESRAAAEERLAKQLTDGRLTNSLRRFITSTN
jgi:hypothetical protein